MSEITQSTQSVGGGEFVGVEIPNPDEQSRSEKNAPNASPEPMNHRVDSAHRVVSTHARSNAADSSSNTSAKGIEYPSLDQHASSTIASAHPLENDPIFAERERILRLHAVDLIAEIQRIAEEVETRESQLNTRDALLDQRERQFRTWEKYKRQEIDDTARLTDHLQQEIKDRLRRIVALELGSSTAR